MGHLTCRIFLCLLLVHHYTAYWPYHPSSGHYPPALPDWPSAGLEYPPPSVYASSPVLSGKSKTIYFHKLTDPNHSCIKVKCMCTFIQIFENKAAQQISLICTIIIVYYEVLLMENIIGIKCKPVSMNLDLPSGERPVPSCITTPPLSMAFFNFSFSSCVQSKPLILNILKNH